MFLISTPFSRLFAYLWFILWLAPQLVLALPEDQYQPIIIEADAALQDSQQQSLTYSGNVSLVQGTLNVHADQIRVRYRDDKTMKSLIATGKPARLKQKQSLDKPIISAKADTIIYQTSRNIITLEGSATVQQGESIIQSEHIEYDTQKQIFNAKGAKESASQNEQTESLTKQRVRVVIPAPQKNDE